MAGQLVIRTLAISTFLVIATHAAAQSTVPPDSLVGRFVDLQNKTNIAGLILSGLPADLIGGAEQFEVPTLA
jgi:hypothetical protein